MDGHVNAYVQEFSVSAVLPRVHLDSRFPSNPKALNVTSRPGGFKAAFAYVCGLAYCGEKGG